MIKAVFLTSLIVLAFLYLVQSVNSLSKSGGGLSEDTGRASFGASSNYRQRSPYGTYSDPYRSSRLLRERLREHGILNNPTILDNSGILVGNGVEDEQDDSVGGLLLGRSRGSDYRAAKKRVKSRHVWSAEMGDTGGLPSAANLRRSGLSASEERRMPIKRVYEQDEKDKSTFGDIYFVAIVAGCSTAAIFGVISAGYCFYKFQQHNKAAADVEYPAYGVVGPATSKENVAAATTGNVSPTGDRKLAQSAQMYHYHHQKQQMIATEKAATSRHTSASDADSDEDNEEGEYTVYECPGLAPTGEMEVKNPLFQDDITPVNTPPVTSAATANCTTKDD